MFTGIIEGTGVLRKVRPGAGVSLAVEAGFDLSGVRLGDSIAVSGACLTATRVSGRVFEADVSPETTARTTLARAKPGDLVNLERAMTLGSRLDGHLVTGHVDGTGTVASLEKRENAILVRISCPAELARQLVEKGSVAVDGISLTVNEVWDDGFALMIIPHTAKVTTIGQWGPGRAVNLETDIIGKYVERLLSAREKGGSKPAGGLSLETLAKNGFM